MDISSTVPGITIKKVDSQNSGDINNGDKSCVVGYVALEFEVPKSSTGTLFVLTDKEKQILLKLARTSISEYIKNKERPFIDATFFTPNLLSSCGAFVSLHINGDLRGCVGTFRTDKALYQNIREMAIDAATNDYRFGPLKVNELNLLDIEISVLTPMHRISSPEEIILGKHGIYIKKDGKSGTLLPQVATDKNWTKEEFLGYCSRDKAGLGWNGWKDAEVYVYEAIIFGEPFEK